MATAEPSFTVVSKKGASSLRDDPPLVVAQVHVAGRQGKASRTGCRKLAGYIFAGNAGAARIAMTGPVMKSRRDGQKIAMTAPVTLIGEVDDGVMQCRRPPASRRTAASALRHAA